MDNEQIFKGKVVKITLHSGQSEDFTHEWQELVFTYEDGEEELVSSVGTSSDSPEDNMLSRIGGHDLRRIVQAVEINPKATYWNYQHDDSGGYLKI